MSRCRSIETRPRREPLTITAAVCRALVGWVLGLALGAKLPRRWQRKAYRRLRPERLRKLRAATGSGKTTVEQVISLSEVFAEQGRRTLIAVPYRDIGRGFRDGRVVVPGQAPWARFAAFSAATVALACALHPAALLLLLPLVPACRLTCTLPWRTKDSWWRSAVPLMLPLVPARWRGAASQLGRATVRNKCDDPDGGVDMAEAYLRGDIEPGQPRIAVVCHASLARAWKNMMGDGLEATAAPLRNVAALRNLTLVIDEAQRAMAVGVPNGIGRAVRAVVRSGDETVRLCLATATFCRHRSSILEPADDAKFVEFTYHFGEHWRESMQSVRRIAWGYVTYGREGWDDALADVLREYGRSTLVRVPRATSATASPESGGVAGKLRDLKRVKAAIRRADPGVDDRDIVDLITDDDGADNSEELRQTMKRVHQDKNDPDYIVALNMMEMGSDVPNLKNVVVLAPGGSPSAVPQQLGRATRAPKRVLWRNWLRLRLHDELRRGVSRAGGAGGWRNRLRLRLAWLWNLGRPDKGRISLTLFFRETDAGATDEEASRTYKAHFAAVISVMLMQYEIAPPTCGGGIDLGPALDWLASPEGEGFLLAAFASEGGHDPATCVTVARRVMDRWHPPIPDNVRAGLEVIVRHLNRSVRPRSTPTSGELVQASPAPLAMELVDAGLDEVHPGMIGALAADMALIDGPDACDRFIKILRGLPNYTEEQVVMALKARMESEPGWCPSANDATQILGLPPGTTCQQLNGAINHRCRGFTSKDDSLYKMCQRNGLRSLDAPDYTEPQVVVAIGARMKSEPGWHPSCKDTTQIPGLPPGTNCRQLSIAISQRFRGFKREDDSLYKMCQRNGLLPADAPDYTEPQVVVAIGARMKSEPDWKPSAEDTTQIPGLPSGTNCHQLDMAIRQHLRGFKREDDSLYKMCQRNGLLLPELDDIPERQIVDAIRTRTMSEPGWEPSTRDDTQITGLPSGITCKWLDKRYRNSESFIGMLRRYGVSCPGAAHAKGAPDYTEPQVVAAIRTRMKSEPGWYPSCRDTTQIPSLPSGTSCKQLNKVISGHCRGFTRKGDSLFRMLQRNGYDGRLKCWLRS